MIIATSMLGAIQKKIKKGTTMNLKSVARYILKMHTKGQNKEGC